ADVARRHVGVGIHARSLRKAITLERSGPIHPLSDRLTRLGGALIGERPVLHGGHFQVDVDAVEQRAGHAREIALHAERAAHAVMLRISEVAAGTSPRCLFAMCSFVLKSRSLRPIRKNSGPSATACESSDSIWDCDRKTWLYDSAWT